MVKKRPSLVKRQQVSELLDLLEFLIDKKLEQAPNLETDTTVAREIQNAKEEISLLLLTVIEED